MSKEQNSGNLLALTPLLVFLVLFLGTGFYLQWQGVDYAFYKLPAPIAALVGIITAFLISKQSMQEQINTFISGVGDKNIITMCLIYLLAGGFAQVVEKTGGVDATVNFGLSFIPAQLVLPGLFIITAFISTAMGTSMGTISAVAPIAVGMAGRTDLSLALTVGVVVGGAMFGDNLSLISDTTIAATQTQGCKMKDKFKANLLLVLPAAILTLVLLLFLGGTGNLTGDFNYNLLTIIPYLLVLGLALAGVNVFIVLLTGTLFAGGVGLINGSFHLLGFANTIYKGFTGMQSIFLLSLFIGGLAELIKAEGGIDYLLNLISSKINSQKGAKLGLGALVSAADICTANNTVAILLVGPLGKDIADKYEISGPTAASILDIFSCVVQGLIPYGAQILLAGSLAEISPLAIIPHLHYQFILGALVIGLLLWGKAANLNWEQVTSQPEEI